MRVYIAGPMSNVPDNNRKAFARAEERLKLMGHVPINPYHLGSKELQAVAADMGVEFRATPEYAALLERCIFEVSMSDAVVLLPGWEDSTGARREKTAAEGIGIPCYPYDDFCPTLRWTGDPHCGPVKQYAGDAGFDLYVERTMHIPYNCFVDVPLGISVQLPTGMWAMLTGRSSTLRNRHLLVIQGIIDNGYRGPLYAGVQNLGSRATVIERGERIAQLIPMPLEAAKIDTVKVDNLDVSDRGERGFGSTGV
jgi:dUTP pyrophosphatase